MTDRPIIFSAPMVKALLAGRKTQTRRLAWRDPFAGGPGDGLEQRPSPWRKVQPGDRLWVREAWALPSNWTGPASRIAASCQEAGYKRPWAPIHYPADGTRDNWGHWREHEPGKVRSPIHMSRWASRLTLTVTDVRVQRLQEISREDAIAEGIERSGGGMLRWERWEAYEGATGMSPPAAYALLWNHLHGPGAWDANPEVVALTFTVEQRNIDA